MRQKQISHRPRAAPNRAGPDDAYGGFKSDRELRNALISRDIRIFGCRLLTAIAIVIVALHTPTGHAVGLVLRLLGHG
ncbi:hypothetical protein THIX_10007 [Thiomonas sp. X19]|nr:hypothetical protein THIX_10007 [Thiomonas sp. X19]